MPPPIPPENMFWATISGAIEYSYEYGDPVFVFEDDNGPEYIRVQMPRPKSLFILWFDVETNQFYWKPMRKVR